MGNTASNIPPPVTETVLGINELSLVHVNAEDRDQRFVKEGGFFLNEKSGALVSFGSFDTPTLEDLRRQVEAMPPLTKAKKNPPPQLTTRLGVDIGELQGKLTTQDRAMVQVASNFNCLENGSRRTNISSGRFVDSAYLDRTQGPAAVFGTTSAYLYRCHFHGGGQSLGHPVNLLQHVPEYFGFPQVGKMTLTGTEVRLRTEEDIDQAAAKVCLGLHRDCPVLFGRSNGALIYNQPKKGGDSKLEFPLVDQVLSASINLWDFGAGSPSNDKAKGEAAQRFHNVMVALLRAAYEGIYLAAILRRRRKLYLTLVGGGCFGNPIPLVVEEIQRAHEKWACHPACVLEEVTICLFDTKEGYVAKTIGGGPSGRKRAK